MAADPTSKLFADFAAFLKKREDHTSVAIATRTVELLRELATQRRWSTARCATERRRPPFLAYLSTGISST